MSVTIVIIEDNLTIRENLEEILQLEGYAVYPAANGEQGLDLVRSVSPQLVISDVHMPLKTGPELLIELKADPTTRDIPFLFLTSSVESKDVKRGLELGASEYIRKPFDAAEITEAIARVLQSANK